jgi:2-polyprenyl-3-methyl-5-hydroxy-6-metoxy-1,4-benzoquinol methylase
MSSTPNSVAPPEVDWWNARQIAASLVPGGSRVLDIGCGWGQVAKWLKPRGCRVTGIEPDPARLAEGAEFFDATYVGTAETLDTLGLEKGSFDVVMLADVLEHLPDPWSTLTALLPYLRPGGRVVVSIPNVANYGARLNLLRGRFRYEDSGLYDRTHLRFFTRETLTEMLSGAGLRLVEWHYAPNLTMTHAYQRTLGRIGPIHRLMRQLDRGLTYRFNRLLAVQFIVACEWGGP